jgi:exonuclease SbcD
LFHDVLTTAPFDDARDDYVEVILDDDSMPPDALGRLREFYPNLLGLSRRQDAFVPGASDESVARQVEKLTDEDLYELFFTTVTGEDIAPEQRAALHELLQEREGERR